MSEFAAEIDGAVTRFRSYLPELLAEVAKKDPSRNLLNTTSERFEAAYGSGSQCTLNYKLENGNIKVDKCFANGSSSAEYSSRSMSYKEFAKILSLNQLKVVGDGIKEFDHDKYMRKMMTEGMRSGEVDSIARFVTDMKKKETPNDDRSKI